MSSAFNWTITASSPAFRLLTLGRLALVGGEGDPGADALRAQRRKLAVLAVLALAREPVSRIVLAEMFWGEQPEERARHSLSEALSHLRRVFGRHAIAARGPEVKLASEAPLVVDAREFTAAVRAERWGEAVALWGGPFLEGVSTLRSRRLEDWIEGEQRELLQLFVRACEREHAGLRAGGRWEEAGAVARRWLDADPLSEMAALALLGALEAADTREADVRAFREYCVLRSRLEREYGAEPGARVAARGAVLQERLQSAGVEELAAVEPAPTVGSSLVALPPAPLTLPAPVAVATTLPEKRTGWRRRTRVVLWSLAAVAALVLARAAAVAWLGRGIPAPSAGRVAVLPFRVSGPPEFAYLREGVVDLLSANLDGVGPLRTVNPQTVLLTMQATPGTPRQVAQRLGAGLYVAGEVVAAGGRLRISAAMFRGSMRDRPVAGGNVEGSPDDLFQLVDQLARLLATSSWPASPLGRTAALTTRSLPALKQYLQGESDFRRALYASAFDAFRAAADEDTTFALAHYRVAQTGQLVMVPGWVWDSTMERSRRALAHSDRLAPRVRLLVQAHAAMVAGGFDEAERTYRAVARSWPDDVEAWTGLGEVLYHTNPVRGRPFLEAAAPFERILALDRGNASALRHLLPIRLRQGRAVAVDSLLARLDSLAPGRAATAYRILHAFADGREANRTWALAELRASGSDELVRVSANRVALYAGDHAGAARILPLLLQEGVAPEGQAQGRIWLADLQIAHGRWRAAESLLSAAAGLDLAQALEQRALLAALPFAPGGAARAAAAESALARWDAERWPATRYPCVAVYNGLHGIIREYLLGLLELRRGDTAASTRRALALLRRDGTAVQREFARGLGESLNAHVAAAAGGADALARFDTARLRVHEGLLELQYGSQAYERWARAELLFRLGHWREALPWYASLPETYIDQLIYEGPAELRQAQIYERLGDRRAARAHYATFVELWRTADPELLPQVEEARARLRALGG